MFIDEVEIHVAAGHGGRGALSFRREKFVPRGGPNGGDGGPGGNVYLVANPNLNTLLNFRFQRTLRSGPRPARRGLEPDRAHRRATSRSKCRSGPGVRDADADGEYVLIARSDGTRANQCSSRRAAWAGAGNAQFATSTNRAPRRVEPGLPGEEKDLRLQLEAARRRRARRLPERRQVHAHLAHLGRQAEDRRLPVHDADPNLGVVASRAIARSSSPTCPA